MQHRIGLIGCGGIAGSWIKAVELQQDTQIALTYDLSREAAQQRAEETGAEAVAALDEIWDRDEIDVVVIGTPTRSHPELVAQAAQAGKHIICEKPMALNLDACRQMLAAVKTAGVKLAIGHSLRFWGAFLTCRRLVAAGRIGAPVSGSIDRMGTAGLRRADETQAADHWRSDPANTGGHALEGFIHELDFARAVFGEVASIACEAAGGEEYDGLLSPQILQALVKFESGALVTARTGSTVALPSRGYWIAGTEGGLHFSGWGDAVEHYQHDSEEPERVSAAEGYAYHRELCDLLTAVETDGEPENSGLNGLKNVALGLGMYRSFETGRRIRCTEGVPLDAAMAGDYQNTRWW
jgi:predicted dehydrogenase